MKSIIVGLFRTEIGLCFTGPEVPAVQQRLHGFLL